MQSATVDCVEHPDICSPELSSMVATLCCYEERFGPYHPGTLRLLIDVAIQLQLQGRIEQARGLLERAIRDVQRFLGRTHQMRLQAIAALRNLLVEDRRFVEASGLQRELVDCQVERLGSDHPETLAARADLETLLLDKLTANREFLA